MSELKKATLQEIKSDESAAAVGDPVSVQFNPSSLKLQITNSTTGGNTRGQQARQFTGSSSTTLTLDLVFDTADEGTTDAPRSVREKTDMVQKFVMPKGEGQNKQAPPKVRFQWGTLILDGVIDSISIDLDHFAADGTPLRAKVGLSIKEQDSKYEFLQSGAGANAGANPPPPGGSTPATPGALGGGVGAGLSASASLGLSASFSASASFGASAQFGVALGGESAAEFAARVGVDPAAWRGLAVTAGGGNSLSLEAGAEVAFSANLSASAGLGVSVGVGVGASVSLETSFGLEVGKGFTAVTGTAARAETAAGFALSAAGGVRAALEPVEIVKSQSAEQQARQAFASPSPSVSLAARGTSTGSARAALPATATATTKTTSGASAMSSINSGAKVGGGVSLGTSTTARPSKPEQLRPALATTGLPSQNSPSAAAPPPPRADTRSATFGFGVPLRPTVGAAADLRAGYLQGSVSLRSQTRVSGDPPMTDDPTTPPWVSLPSASRSRDAADKLQSATHPSRACGCGGGCGHRKKVRK